MDDIAARRLDADELERNFADIHVPLDRKRALIEASRCYFCYDAPCLQACPTGIDIPGFIRKIATDNVKGAAITILSENVMGGACARVCPVEVLCEAACVREAQESKPVRIGALQRYATDWLFDRKLQPFERGVAADKVPNDFAQAEVAFILALGGIHIEFGKALGRDVSLAKLRQEFDAVFLGLGLAGVNALALDGEDMAGVLDAVAYIERLRQAKDKGVLEIGRRVVVIGGGNTAIDIAVQAKRLGAEDVTIVYRRGPEQMGATWHEQELAQTNDVRIKHWARPLRLISRDGRLKEVEFEYTQLDDQGRLLSTGDRFTLLADMLFKAIGQTFVASPLGELLELSGGRIAINADRQTSLAKVWAGGDCVPGEDLTVNAVQDGKIAAEAIDRALCA